MARRSKLKVFRTPIGFHDAYVAAPSQKAALEAWGSDSNLFAQGIAEQVTDRTLIKEPLEHPGEVIKKLRGTVEEQGRAAGRRKPGASALARRKAQELRRAKAKEIEREIAAEEARHRAAAAELDKEEKRLEQRRAELQRHHEAERRRLTRELEEIGS